MGKTLMTFAPLLFALSACSTLTVTTPPAACANLILATWREGIEATPIPAGDDAKAWSGAYVGASADTEKANGRTRDAIDIFANCEAMVNAARVKR